MELKQYNDKQLFKQEVTGFLGEYEVENNLILGVLKTLDVNSQLPLFMATVKKNDHLALVMLQTHPRQVILSKSVNYGIEDVYQVAQEILQIYPTIPGLIGEKKTTEDLAKILADALGIHAEVHMNQRIYKLTKVQKVPVSNGRLVIVDKRALPLIRDWVYSFCDEVGEHLTVEEAEQKAITIIEKKRLYAWEVNGNFVSMAASTRATDHNITINFVFTPQKERKKGYASSCVSSLTGLMLENGYKTTSLYTDLANPTSNKIYKEIGYEEVMDSIVYHFLEK